MTSKKKRKTNSNLKRVLKAMRNPKFVFVNIGQTWQTQTDKSTGELTEGGFRLSWGAKGIGWGQITIHQEGEEIVCETEHMGRKFVKQALEYFVKNLKIVE